MAVRTTDPQRQTQAGMHTQTANGRYIANQMLYQLSYASSGNSNFASDDET